MKLISALLAVLALAFVACDQAEEAEVGGAEVRGEAEIAQEDVVNGVRTLCEELPLRDLAEQFGVEVNDEQALAEQIAEPFPQDIRQDVEEGCLEGLEASAASPGTESPGEESPGTESPGEEETTESPSPSE